MRAVNRRAPARRRRLGFAALASSTALLLSGCEFDVYSLPLPGGADVGDNPYRVQVQFRDVLDLVPQSVVKVDDVTAGMVEEIEVRDYTASVTLQLHDDVKLPANAQAKIRQTSLLGEKFVSLAPPSNNPSSRELENGDVIPLERSGRNPEIEEVLGALSLLLNGGGIGQLKIITQEFNKVFEGREGAAKSVLRQIEIFMTQLDGSKFEILEALENINELSKSISANKETLDLALQELPSAIESIDSQRDDLVTMLEALADLSSTGVRVIRASKQGTIRSLEALAPILREIDRAGDNFPKALQVFLTYPFVDAVVGKTAQAARDLHMGDYTNLSVNMQIKPDVLLQAAGQELPNGQLCLPIGCFAAGDLTKILPKPPKVPDNPLPGGGGDGDGDGGPNVPGVEVPSGNRNGGGGGGGGGGAGGGLPNLGRAAPDGTVVQQRLTSSDVDTELAGLLAWGAMPR
jgi:phospholipid/cholesterol/gamma-HCH transport system substrate-binding protein